MPDTVETARDRIYKLLVRWLPEEDWDVIDPALNALIAAVRAENTRKDRENPLIVQYEREIDRLNACIAALAEDANLG